MIAPTLFSSLLSGLVIEDMTRAVMMATAMTARMVAKIEMLAVSRSLCMAESRRATARCSS